MRESNTGVGKEKAYILPRLLMVWLYRLILLVIMALGICLYGVLPIRVTFRDCAVVLTLYMVLLLILQETYHACSIGKARVSEMVVSQSLANFLCAGISYFCIVLFVHRFFNPLPLLLVVVLQTLFSYFWSVQANRYYYAKRRRLRAVVFYGTEEALQQLIHAPYFNEKYDIAKMLFDPQPDPDALYEEMKDCDVVFTMGISSIGNSLIAKLCLQLGIKGYFSPRLGQIILTGAEFRSNFGVPMLRVERAGGICEYRFFKRLFDFCVSAIGIIVASPIMLAVAIAIWMEDHGPVFYSQTRLTRNGREFKILKFRSMTVNAEQDGVARLSGQNDSRITRVGSFIRVCRMDELPQLFNILKGDMSIVGPRPERPEIAAQYAKTLPEFALRLQVKAGLTGIAQVFGRYNTAPYHKLQMDLMYINEMSFLKDLQLILATVRILFVKESTQGFAPEQVMALEEKDHASKSA